MGHVNADIINAKEKQSAIPHPCLSVICDAPLTVHASAMDALIAFARGEKNFTRTRSRHYLVIRLGIRWRLLSKDDGNSWSLMTHETYNRESCK